MRFVKRFLVIVIFLAGFLLIYTSSLIGVAPEAKQLLHSLEEKLLEGGYSSSYWVISGRRWAWDNALLVKFGGAANNSQHLAGNAIDMIILDVNEDGISDELDVDIVYNILDQEIIGQNGGLGTYKREKGFLNRQMIHFDCRGSKARWHR